MNHSTALRHSRHAYTCCRSRRWQRRESDMRSQSLTSYLAGVLRLIGGFTLAQAPIILDTSGESGPATAPAIVAGMDDISLTGTNSVGFASLSRASRSGLSCQWHSDSGLSCHWQ